MKKLFPIFILLFAFSVFAQSEKASLNSWRGLTLDESTIADSKRILGEPEKTKENEKFTPLIYNTKWFGSKNEKRFTKLSFKQIDSFDGANLYFSDGKLKIIELDLKKDLTASALVDAYDARFFPLVGKYGAGVTPNDLANPQREIEYPDKIPPLYNMGAANAKAIGIAQASVGSWEGAFAIMTSPAGKPGVAGAGVPGLVRKLQLVSRTLEDQKASNLLK